MLLVPYIKIFIHRTFFFFLKGHLLALSGIIDGEYQDRFTVNDSSGFHIMGLRKASICWTHDKLGMRLP